MCFDQLYQLQLGKPSWGSWGKQNSGFAIPVSIHASSLSFSLSSGNKLFFFYIRKQPHSWSAVTHWLIFLSHRTHNHCDQLSSCSQMTTFIWYGLPPVYFQAVIEGHSHFRMLGMWQFIFFLFSSLVQHFYWR